MGGGVGGGGEGTGGWLNLVGWQSAITTAKLKIYSLEILIVSTTDV